MAPPPAVLPPIAQAILTRRIPCAILAIVLFEIVRLPIIGLPLHGLLLALFPVIFYGGGLLFAIQAGLFAALITGVVHQDILTVLLLLIGYISIPLLAAYIFLQTDGLRRASTFLAICAITGVLGVFTWMASTEQLDLFPYSLKLIESWVDMSISNATDLSQIDREQITHAVAQILPGMLAVIIWAAWLGHLLLARKFASAYAFFPGETIPFTRLRFGLGILALFCITLIAMLLLTGTGHFYSLNLFLIMAALLVAQGLSVVHVSLQKFNYPALIWLLYFILLVQPVFCIVPMFIGVLDYWFDYRKLKTEEHNSGTDST